MIIYDDMIYQSKTSKEGVIKVADGTTLRLKIMIIDVREAGFSPFGGINLNVKAIGGVATQEVPEALRKEAFNKPLAPSEEPPHDGWETIKITEQDPAVEEGIVETSQGKFVVRVIADVVMAARNINYRTIHNEPIYWISWVWKISWEPIKEG
jgi:hypothetical protein